VRKVFGPLLLGLGAFLLVVGVLAVTWAPGVVKRTPLDVNNTTNLEGEAQRLDAETGELGSPVPITIQSITQTDAERSTDDVAVWVTGSCVVENPDGETPPCVDGDDPRLISASEDTFATDRVSALAVPNGDFVPADTVQHEGLINKWPFDAEKKTYPYWDGTVGAAVDAVYQETEDIEGIETYRYQINIDEEPIEIAEGVSGTYTNEVSIWVEPKTGAILNQSQDQQRYLESGAQVLNLRAEFTDDQIKESVDDAESNMLQLSLLVWAPIIGFIGGGLALLAGIALVLTGRRRDGDHSSDRELADANA
jgi:hypothetical protein